MPFWLLTSGAIAAERLSISSASRSMTPARRAGSQAGQPTGSSKAARAASTAASMSASTASGTLPRRSSVLGETTVILAAEDGAFQAPPR